MPDKKNGVIDCKLYINREKLEQGDEFVCFARIFTKDGEIGAGSVLRCINTDSIVYGLLQGITIR